MKSIYGLRGAARISTKIPAAPGGIVERERSGIGDERVGRAGSG